MKLTKSYCLCFLLCFFLACSFSLKAQFFENFNESNFTFRSKWIGDTAKFLVKNQKLQSNSTIVNDKFYMAGQSNRLKNTEWSILLNLQFNPSSNNFIDYFLSSDSANLLGNNTGYFLRIGGTADNIVLYKKNKSVLSAILSGRAGRLNYSDNLFLIKVTYDSFGKFYLWDDSTGTGNQYYFEGSALDTSLNKSNFFGLSLRQSTASFHNKHFFDDWYIGKIRRDSLRPEIKSVSMRYPDSILIEFSEPMGTHIFDSSNLKLKEKDWLIAKYLNKANRDLLILTKDPFESNKPFGLTLSHLKDTSGNELRDTSLNLNYILWEIPKPYELLISELLPDPDPPLQLPNLEFVELYNRTEKFLNLEGCSISDQTGMAVFTECKLAPKSYLIVCAWGNENSFKPFGKVLGLKNFPVLNNAGEEWILRGPKGNHLHRIKYDLGTYRNAFKQNGGYSIEMIDPANPCNEDNFMASESITGGTPGKQNSLSASNPDIKKPWIQSVYLPSADKVVLLMSETMDSLTAFNLGNFEINLTGIGEVKIHYETIELKLLNSLEKDQNYVLTIKNLTDCSGNLLQDTQVNLALPRLALPGDLIINELLFNPPSGGYDFIELFNPSGDFLSLKNLSFFNRDKNGNPADIMLLDTQGLFIKPNQYLAITDDPAWLKSNYPGAREEHIIQSQSLPGLDDKSGSIGISYGPADPIDELSYSEKMHNPLLTHLEGVSLERIRPDLPSAEQANWTSAASTYGYATPGYKNSHQMDQKTGEGWFHMDKEYFTPDDDGVDDLIEFSIVNEKPNASVSLYIFNHEGFQIQTLANNKPIGNRQTWHWNGLDSENKKAAIGLYIVYAELHDLNGARKFKKVALALGGN